MDLRHLTVGYRPVDARSQASWPQPAPSRMPFVRLSDRWLARAGFGFLDMRSRYYPFDDDAFLRVRSESDGRLDCRA